MNPNFVEDAPYSAKQGITAQAVPPCHEIAPSEMPAPESGWAETGHLCLCASGGCATSGVVVAHSIKPFIVLNSSDYPSLVEHVLTQALPTPLRPPSFA